MVNGVQIDYELKDGCASRFNQKMFGRISKRVLDYKTYAYYIPGVLDTVPHARIFEGRIFVATCSDVNYGPILQFCTKFKTSSTSKEVGQIFVQTGRQKWTFHAKEKGLDIFHGKEYN